jgi:hypothetical protein
VRNNVKSHSKQHRKKSDSFEYCFKGFLSKQRDDGKYGKGISIGRFKLKDITPELNESATNISQDFRKSL